MLHVRCVCCMHVCVCVCAFSCVCELEASPFVYERAVHLAQSGINVVLFACHRHASCRVDCFNANVSFDDYSVNCATNTYEECRILNQLRVEEIVSIVTQGVSLQRAPCTWVV